MMPLVCRIMKATASGGGMLGGHDEVALVLAVLIVQDQDHAPGAQLAEQLLDGIQRSGRGRRLTLK